MKKILSVIAIVIVFISLYSCKPKNENYINLLELYESIDVVKQYFDEIEVSNIELVKKEELSKDDVKRIKNLLSVDFISYIGGHITDNPSIAYIVAYEFKNNDTATSAYLNYFTKSYPGMYRVIENVVFLDSYPTYIWLNDYSSDENGTIYNAQKTKVLKVSKDISVYEIPSEIKEITSMAFGGPNLVEIKFNENLKRINAGGCGATPNLKEVYFNDGLEEICKMAFYGCTSLETVVIPKSVKFIGENAFNYGNIFCEAKSRSPRWKQNFASGNAIVYWAGEWEYDENNKPVPIEQVDMD